MVKMEITEATQDDVTECESVVGMGIFINIPRAFKDACPVGKTL